MHWRFEEEVLCAAMKKDEKFVCSIQNFIVSDIIYF